MSHLADSFADPNLPSGYSAYRDGEKGPGYGK